MDRIEAFLGAVLADVPPGRYRSQAETELRDHIETGCEELSGGEKTHREAVEEVLHTMGDPETLRKEYDAAWRRRELSFFWPLYTSLLLYALAIALTVPVYLFGDFGKAIVGLYSLAAVPLVLALACMTRVRGRWKWGAIAWLCALCAALQLPPFLCWMTFICHKFYVFGIIVPGWVGGPVHFALGIWGLVNFGVARSKRRRSWERRAA